MPTRPWSARRPDRKSSQEGELLLFLKRYFISERYSSERWRGRRSKHRQWGEIQRQRLPPSDVHPGRVHVQPKQWCWAHCGWPRPCSPWRGSSPWRAGLALWIRWWGSVVRPLGTVWHSFEWHGFADFLLHISLDIKVQRGSRAEQIFHQARRYWVQPYANSTKMLVSMMKSWLKLGMKELLEDKWWYRNVSKSENRSTQLLKLCDCRKSDDDSCEILIIRKLSASCTPPTATFGPRRWFVRNLKFDLEISFGINLVVFS